METLTTTKPWFEASSGYIEELTHSQEQQVRLGRLAIKADQLGINDPVTHLYQYIEKGTPSLPGIREDIETDIAERLPKTPFVNQVNFRFNDKDFVSVKDAVSMRSMTETNLRIFKEESSRNPELTEECERAQAEVEEVEKLSEWFKSAKIGSYLIFESLPIGQQQFAIVRIYQKTSNTELSGHFVSLYNPSLEQFNILRHELGPTIPAGDNVLDILKKNYEFYNHEMTDSDQFINYYVQIYDDLLDIETGRKHRFGIESSSKNETRNGLEKVRGQQKLTSVYIDTIRAIADCGGVVNVELAQIHKKLGIRSKLEYGQQLSIQTIQDILSEVIARIASVIDRADSQLLTDLEHFQSDSEANMSAMSFYGDQAKADGATYSSGGCPEVNRTANSNNSATESDILNSAFNIFNTPNNFGRPKIGVCRISNCPTRGELTWWSNRTLVGGCDICVCCHKILEKGQSPQRTYDKQRKEAAEKAKTEQFRRNMHAGKPTTSGL